MNDPRQRYYDFGEFRLDTFESLLTRNGEPLALTHRCYNLLLTFVTNGGHLLTHDELMQSVWEETAVDRSSLKQNIATLRKTLGDIHEQPQYIQTVPKFGYRFIAGVTSQCDDNLLLVAERQSVTVFDVENETVSRSFKRLPAAAWMVLIAVIGVSAYFLFAAGVLDRFRLSAHASTPLSFENVSWRKLTNAGNVTFAVVSPDAHFVAYVAGSDGDYQSLRLLNVSDLSEMTIVPPDLVHYWSVAFTNDGGQIYFVSWNENGPTTESSLYRVSTLGGKTQKILENIGGGVSFSPDGSRFTFNRTYPEQNKTVVITADSADGGNQQIVATSPADSTIAPSGWSPDGTKILYFATERRDDGVYSFLAEVPATGGDATIITGPSRQRFLGARWADGGRGIMLSAAATDSKALQIYYVTYPEGKITRVTNDLNNYFFPNSSSDSRVIVATEQERMTDVYVADVADRVPHKVSKRAGTFETVTWTQDGRIVFDSHEDGKFHMWTMNTDGDDAVRVSAAQLEDKRPAVSPDGKFLVFISNRGGYWQLWRTRIDGSEPLRLTTANEPIADVHFGVDENDIVYQRYVGSAWTLARVSALGGEPQTFVGDAYVGAWNVSPDGEWVAYFRAEEKENRGSVVLQSLKDAGDSRLLDIKPSEFLAFDPSDKALITKQNAGEAPQSCLWKFPIDGGKPTKLIDNPPDAIYSASYSPDGKHIAWVQGKLVANIVLLIRTE